MGAQLKLKVLFVATAVVALVAGVGVSRSEAAAGFTWSNSTLIGTSGNDVLAIGYNGTHWTHNRFALGDAGFESADDFDPGTLGVQSRSFDQPISTNLGTGDDTLRFVGLVPRGNILQFAHAGEGNDVLDCSQLDLTSAGVGMGSGGQFTSNWQAFERFVGTAFDDSLTVDVYGYNSDLTHIDAGPGDDYVFGTNRNETIDGGTGSNEIHANGGDDTIVIRAPFTNNAAPKVVEGSLGNDLVKVIGTSGPDVIELISFYSNVRALITEDSSKQGGARPESVEAFEVDLGAGDDGLYAEAVEAPVAAHGGEGADDLLFNALRYAESHDATHITARGFGVLTHDGFEAAEVVNDWFVVTGTLGGGAPHVRAFDAAGASLASYYAYDPNFGGGVNVAVGDLNGDGVDEIVTAPGPGGGPHVRIFNRDGSDTGLGFYAYDQAFTGGVRVAAGDLDGDGIEELITAPATNGGPHIRVWTAEGDLLTEFFADGFANTGLYVGSMGTPSGYDVVAVGSGPNANSRLSLFDAEGEQVTTPIAPFGDFRGGVSVSGYEPELGGYRNGVVVSAGPGGGPHVRTFTHNSLGSPLQPVGSFYAFDPAFTGGAAVSAGVEQRRTQSPLVVAAGRGASPHVHGVTAAGQFRSPSFFAYGQNFAGGVTVAVSGARGWFQE